MIRAGIAMFIAVSALCFGGCAATGGGEPASVALAPGQYARAFDQTRDVLREMGFVLERVDAQSGVITTQPKGTAGLVSPWDKDQSTFSDGVEDALNRHRRVVRVEFFAADAEAQSEEVRDLRAEKGAVRGEFSVAVYRWYIPGWRICTESILNSSYTHDPQLDERGMGSYGVAVRQDDALAKRIADRVRAGLASPSAVAGG